MRLIYPNGRTLLDLDPLVAWEWREWMARNGLPDPQAIPLESVIECDDDARTVACEVVVTKDPNDPWSPAIRDPENPDKLLHKRVVVQLESPALPCPEGGWLVEET